MALFTKTWLELRHRHNLTCGKRKIGLEITLNTLYCVSGRIFKSAGKILDYKAEGEFLRKFR